MRSTNLPLSSWHILAVLALASGRIESAESAGVQGTHHVALFTGSEEGAPFWQLFADFMGEASQDLGMTLEVFYADGSRRRMTDRIRTVCERPNRPDALVIQSFKHTGPSSLRIAEQHEMPVFLVNAGLSPEEQAEIGTPREDLRHWIGEMLPDDFGAGYQLAAALIDEARRDRRRLGPDGLVHVIAINGVVSHSASVQRLAGLRALIAERRGEATLEQVISADWQQDLARKRCRILYRRYPHAAVVWTASDHMAVGAIAAVDDCGREPGRDVIIGGVDATPEAMGLLEEGTLYATVGGHFMEGGWIAVLVHDYLHGLDPAEIPTRSASPMTLVTLENLAEYRRSLDRSTWERFDFRRLSRVRNRDLDQYRFGTEVVTADVVPEAQQSTPPPGRENAGKNNGRER